MINLKAHTRIALGYFFLVGLLGLFLRSFFVTAIPANYRYVVHAHSHIALLGWVYIALTTLIYKLYFPEGEKAKTYRRIFWFTQITLLGMLFTFPFTGYALYSITFSTLFLFASYLFTWFVLKRTSEEVRNTYSFRLIKAALWYLVFSSVGPWALGGVMATLGKDSIWYNMAIYFYLHFQYNAWFIFALCGILFYFLEKRVLLPKKRVFDRFFYLLNTGVILSFFLSVLWVKPHWIFYVLAGSGAIIQLLAFADLFKILRNFWQDRRFDFPSFVKLLLLISGILLAGKILLQLLSAIPYFADLAFSFPDFVIGYLHWTFLGVVSLSLFAFLWLARLYKVPKMAFWIYFAGFVLSEAFIFYKGISVWAGIPVFAEYFVVLVAVSSLLPLSIGIMFFKSLLTKNQHLS
ncbi:hypothetical protein [Salinimicrobium soli]|uniref:hypothetical protein n=1 Tax=Salinimicrobium soli TaxID=1254399 RepID=UPI003AAE9F3A